jgi:hypothetical protein
MYYIRRERDWGVEVEKIAGYSAAMMVCDLGFYDNCTESLYGCYTVSYGKAGPDRPATIRAAPAFRSGRGPGTS